MSKRSFWFLVGFCLVVMLLPALVMGKPFLTCDPQPHAEEYNVFLNGNPVAVSTAQLDITSGYYYLWFDLATLGLVDGSYIATATAENAWGVSGLSNECPFVKVVPVNPLNLHVSGE